MSADPLLSRRTWTAPNILSAIRILLVPVFVWAMTARRPWTALAVFSAAALTDFLDGLTARALRQKSRLGQLLDPAADKLLMSAAFVLCTIPSLNRPHVLPLILTAVVIGRDAAIVLGAWLLFRLAGIKDFPPSLWGKISTICQMACLFFLLASNALGRTDPLSFKAIVALTLAATLVSAGHYFYAGLAAGSRRRGREPSGPAT